MERIDNIREALAEIHRIESRPALATLIRLLGDFDLAEEALQDAFAAALEKWPETGIPENPRSWLISAGRFRAIDAIRRRARFNASLAEVAENIDSGSQDEHLNLDGVQDDDLRLIFTCCHPALSPEARTALTLREVCGLSTEEIAHAFIISPPTVAQRIVRAKAKIREAKIPYHVPTLAELPERLDAVLQVIYLVFNEGYSASFGEEVTRGDLSREAIRLGRLLCNLLLEPEACGLLALMLIQESRRETRTDEKGDLVLLEDQDRTRWNQDMIAEGRTLVEAALRTDGYGPYTIQAAIASIHARARRAQDTDWSEIVALYDVLLGLQKSPVVELNRAVAVAMRDGWDAGIRIVDEIQSRGELTNYHLAYSARAELCRRGGRLTEALDGYLKALELVTQAPEARYLTSRVRTLEQQLEIAAGKQV